MLTRPAGPEKKRRLALLVGIGKYKCDDLPDLRGPRHDVAAVYQLLTGPGGYDFHPRDVFRLLDEEATVEGFRVAFERTLLERARPGDVAFFYFAGHGSQVRDLNGDEPDGWDETLVFHDSRTAGISDLVDDELNEMLAALCEKTDNVVVAFDACSSGSATRGWAVPRTVPPADGARDASLAAGDPSQSSNGGWRPKKLPGLVALAAAADGTTAFELDNGDHGIFTAALVDELSRVGERPWTWSQVARRLPRKVAAWSLGRQSPAFEGAMHKVVFNARERRRPPAWEVVEAGETVALRGVHLPGWGVGARLRVLAANARPGRTLRAKAKLRVTRYDGLGASAVVSGAPWTRIEPGDLAVLDVPAPATCRIPIRLDGVDEEAFRRALAKSVGVSPLLERLETADTFTLRRDLGGGLRLFDPEGRLRNVFGAPDPEIAAVRTLGRYARQIALLLLGRGVPCLGGSGLGGSRLECGETLAVRIVPFAGQPERSIASWMQESANTEQLIPTGSLCQIEVTNTHSEITLLVGGALLWGDGDIDGLPRAGGQVSLAPGASAILDPGAAFEAGQPTGFLEHVVIFGTSEDLGVDWSSMTASASSPQNATTRGAPPWAGVPAGSGWISSHVPFRIVR